MRKMPVLSVIMVAIFLACVSMAQRLNASDTLICADDGTIEPFDQLAIDSIAADPISAVGHGTMLNAEGEVIDATPEFVLEAQRFYLRSLFHQADEQQRSEFKEKQAHLMQGTQCNEQGLVDVNFELIAWLIDQVKPENASSLASINTFLHEKFATATNNLSPGQGASATRMLDILTQEGMPRLATELSGQAYIDACKAAGVPIPPDWGSSDWKHKGDLSRNQLFLFSIPIAEVWTFESSSPRGICFALPRHCPDTSTQLCEKADISKIELLGIICQGSDTSKVCFWDNQRVDPDGRKRSFPIPKNTTVPLADFAGGAALEVGGAVGGVCTNCHAGENPFIVHPGTVLQTAGGALLKPNNWYDPLVHPNWPQNPGPTTLLNNIPSTGSCIACHNRPIIPSAIVGAFPEVSRELSSYCTSVLQPAIDGTIPIREFMGLPVIPPVTGSPATMPPPPFTPGDPSYREHTKALLAACMKSKGELASDNTTLKGNSPAESFMPCFPEGSECPRKKSVTFMLSEAAEVFIRYDLGQSHGCCADHAVGLLRILRDGTEVHRDTIPYVNYGVAPFDLEDFDYFFPPEMVKGSVPPASQFDSTRVGDRLDNYEVVNRFSLGNLSAGSHTVELQVGDAGWNEVFEIYTLQ